MGGFGGSHGRCLITPVTTTSPVLAFYHLVNISGVTTGPTARAGSVCEDRLLGLLIEFLVVLGLHCQRRYGLGGSKVRLRSMEVHLNWVARARPMAATTGDVHHPRLGAGKPQRVSCICGALFSHRFGKLVAVRVGLGVGRVEQSRATEPFSQPSMRITT